jgi:putative ABC transport system substrate-binding protein
MILAVGVDALSKVKKIKDIPIVYLMVPNPQSVISKEENITGVNMNIPPEKQLGLLQEVLYQVKRVGLLYDPSKTGFFVEKALYSSEKLEIKLVLKEVHNPKDVPSMLDSMKDGIDAFWMLPDTTVITPETVEYLFLFSLENKIPVLTFSDKYLDMGAMISVGIDAFDIGRQAGEIAKEILSGTNIKNLPRVDARKSVLTLNLRAAKKLEITVKNKIISKARIID